MPSQTDLKFKLCKIDDLLNVRSLAHQIWPSAFEKILTKKQIDYMLEMMYNLSKLKESWQKGHLFYLVSRGQNEIGFVDLELNFPDLGNLRIHKIYLLQSEQGKGIGKWMMNQVVELAHQNRVNILHLNVNKLNKATHFYLNYGFEIISEEDIDIGRGYFMNDFVMAKKLEKK